MQFSWDNNAFNNSSFSSIPATCEASANYVDLRLPLLLSRRRLFLFVDRSSLDEIPQDPEAPPPIFNCLLICTC
jgi:hypothetical protein